MTPKLAPRPRLIARDRLRGQFDLARSLERTIQAQVPGGVLELNVHCRESVVRLEGRCRTHYAKQIAQQVAFDLTPRSMDLLNEIVVRSS